jgi:transposase-like protein
VKLIEDRGGTVAQAARDLGVHGTVLRRWVREGTVSSTGERNTCIQYSCWGLKSQRFARSLVQS